DAHLPAWLHDQGERPRFRTTFLRPGGQPNGRIFTGGERRTGARRHLHIRTTDTDPGRRAEEKPMSILEPNHRILVIDDNTAIHDDLRKILLGDSHQQQDLQDDESLLFGIKADPLTLFEIDSAYQGQEGLAKLEQSIAADRPYALAFVDVRMPPGWDG